MREEPGISGAAIGDFLREQYRIQPVELSFLPQGGDINAALYRVTSADGAQYLLKLLRGDFDQTSAMLPRFLAEQGVRQVIAPNTTNAGLLWARLAGWHAVLYPFVEGQNAFAAPLTDAQWADFGAALRKIHDLALPPEWVNRLRRETFPPEWRERVRALMARVERDRFDDPIAAQYAGQLKVRSGEILSIVQKAERLAAVVQVQRPELVLCHSDIHAGNLLIDAAGSLYIIDWDHPLLAPRERDLMFIGGGVGSAWYMPHEERLFYEGYGQVEVNPAALAYYRFERIVEDIAEWGELVLSAGGSVEDRARALSGLARWFSPNDVVAAAYRAEKA